MTDEDLLSLASASDSRQARVRALRERIDNQPAAAIMVDREALLELLSPPPVTEDGDGEDDERDPVSYAQTLLAQHGLTVRPALKDADAGPVEVATTPKFAVQGAIAVTVIAVLAGLFGFWVYGVLYAAVGAIAVAIVARAYPRMQRSAPAWLPPGRLLGAAVALAALLVITVGAVVPIRQHRNHVGKARGLVVQADQLIDQGKIDQAKADLFAAEELVDRPPLIDDVRAHLVVAQVQRLLAVQSRNEGLLDEAGRAFRRGDFARAIAIARRLGNFRDAAERLRAYRATQRRARHGD